MNILSRYVGWAVFAGLAAGSGAYAQISAINSVSIKPRVFNDVPGSTLSVLNKYPAGLSITDSGVSQATGFANRHVWSFSADNGATAHPFKNDEYFQTTVNLTLSGNPNTPRKEAGLLLSGTSSGDIQFVVNTDAHEVVQFGGIGFYSFNTSKAITYNAGDTITLGIKYFLDANGKNALVFSANGVESPVEEFTTGGIGDGSTLGGYFQIVNDPANPLNSGTATFAKIAIAQVPEPTTCALLGLGAASAWLMRRRRS